MTMFNAFLLLSYILGTLFGAWLGFRSGVRTGSELTVSALMADRYLLFKRTSSGEIEFIKPQNLAEIPENQ